ncbi:GNAT family N-acetyltransferase [Paucibacter sp. AS339]|uniref:GNAT family N-acetyltransferase n=1 Tax=Paucibacter hankyongi TaxID=3133434 RepID=UPI0030B13A18
MTHIRRSSLRKKIHQGARHLFAWLPAVLRFAIYRLMVDCDPAPESRLELKIAETKEELEQCFRILHDAYVSSGFMKPDPSGMRITMYHALPTTTTLCAKYDGRVVGTISMIREGVFGFPLQSVFDLEGVRIKGGNIAEISALAVHPDFRKTGGAILFPLMKFMREYCVEYFDTRHLVIAVNPEKIELYEALLFFERLQETTVDQYDFANGAPAVGATLDLKHAAEIFRSGYKGRPAKKNLYSYFFQLKLANIKLPSRRYFTTNDPVMTPELLNYFFNSKTQLFDHLDDRKKSLLWSIYTMAEFRSVLPMMQGVALESHPLRQHQRYSLSCPGSIAFTAADENRSFVVNVVELSFGGFQAECKLDLPIGSSGRAVIELGNRERSEVIVTVMRRKETELGIFYGFKIDEPDSVWRRCVAALEVGHTSADLMQ